MRTLDASNRALARERIAAIAEHTAAALGAKADVTWEEGYPVTVNTPDETEHAIAAAPRDLRPRRTGGRSDHASSEDFAYMLEARPGAYIFLGNGASAPCHHPAYDFDDRAIPFGRVVVCRDDPLAPASLVRATVAG